MNKKTKIYVIVLIWVAVGLQFIVNSSIDMEKTMVTEAMSDGVSNLDSGSIKAYGYYGEGVPELEKMKQVAVGIGSKLGITDGYTIEVNEDSQKNKRRLIFNKKGAYADTTISVASIDNETYIITDIMFNETGVNSIYDYKTKLEKLYEEYGMEPSSNIYLCNKYKGKLSDSQVAEMVNDYLQDMDAEIVMDNDYLGIRCVYGYSHEIKDYVYQDDKKINVNIVFTYDEENDITIVHRATPFVDKTF